MCGDCDDESIFVHRECAKGASSPIMAIGESSRGSSIDRALNVSSSLPLISSLAPEQREKERRVKGREKEKKEIKAPEN